MRLSRPLRSALVGALALVAVVVATGLALRPPPHKACANFRFSPAEWRIADGGRRETLGRLIVRCHTVSHLTLGGVRRALGPPRWAAHGSSSWSLDSSEHSVLEVTAAPDGHVTGVRVEVAGVVQAGLPLTA
jgi:hypothetical protein